MSQSGRVVSSVVFLATVFVSAFLLFQVQPLISKFILPWFGGSPAVWTTCMLFFQVTLFAGYLYAHLVVSRLGPKTQAALHLSIMVVAACLLPITPDSSWKPTNANDPVGRILLLLAATVGLPYFVLSTTGPLLQGWFARAFTGASPYRLYALSNIGSLLALLSYPFVVEPRYPTEQQATFWSIGFVTFVVLGVTCAGLALRAKPVPSQSDTPVGEVTSAPAPSTGLIGLWIALAAVPSALLLAVTNQVCTDIAVVPFLWVLPLSIYLVTFILTFDSDRWYRRRLYVLGMFVAATVAAVLLWGSAANWRQTQGFLLQGGTYMTLLFCACMVCHGELVSLKPTLKHLTLFYLCLSLGGAIGGSFVGLVAPNLFSTLKELPITIVATFALIAVVMRREQLQQQAQPVSTDAEDPEFARPSALWGWGGMSIVAGVFAIVFWQQQLQVTRNAVATMRNFYGTLAVKESRSASSPEFNSFYMQHGQIRHGHQFQLADRRRWPTTYYSREGGGGIAVSQHRSGQSKRVGLIGLGTGTMCVYGEPGDYYRIYEINPDVVTLAQEHFTYLSECKAKHDIVIEDGRIALENEDPQNFDVLVLDAFSGDAIPTHLLTRDCAELYLKHLADDGILACHISNRHVDLRGVCLGLAEALDLKTMALLNQRDGKVGAFTSVWVLMSRRAETLQALRLGKTRQVSLGSNSVLWTDSFSNLFSVLRMKGIQYEFLNGKRNIANNETGN